MHDRTRELLQHLDESEAGFGGALAAIPSTQHDRRPVDDVWSAANVMSHLARTEGQVTNFLQRALQKALDDGLPSLAVGAGSVLASMDRAQIVDRTTRLVAPDFASPDPAMTAEVAQQKLERVRVRTRELLMSVDGLDTSGVRRAHHVLGELTFEQWLGFVGFHQQRHTAQVRELAGKLV